jgi:glycosyltransferase involved in cell wall biosynthesis
MLTTSIIVPCLNEEDAIAETVNSIIKALSVNGVDDANVIVVDDGSSDGTADILQTLQRQHGEEKMRVVTHSRTLGYGAALKSGIRRSTAEYIFITDADGTYPNERIPEFIELAAGRDMLVGARTGSDVEYSKIRSIPKMILVPWVSLLSGHNVPDMNSGFRIFKRDTALRFLNVLPDGFSFTTTITICLLRNRYEVAFVPISYQTRIGKSHIKPIRDTLRFVQLITRTGMYFAPLRLLAPVVIGLVFMFFASLIYDFVVLGNITDKTILFATSSLNIAVFALLADMIDKRTS